MLNRFLQARLILTKPSIFIYSFKIPNRSITTAARLTKQLSIGTTPRPRIEQPFGCDELYKRICVEVRGHDPAVLDSYEKFVRLVSTELGLNLVNVENPAFFTERWTLLRSKFAKKKYWREYEIRTHYKKFHFQHLTGSTTDTFLEYVQRNLPEGVMMIVQRVRLEPFRDNLIRPPSTTPTVAAAAATMPTEKDST